MKTAFRIFIRDLKRLSRNRAAALVMVGVCLLPSLYAWFNIAANMDPYGNTAGIKVAIANSDQGASSDMISLNAGDTIVKNLKENKQLGWVFVDEKQAKQGVRSGKYYAAIVIPDDFSNSLLSVLSGEVKSPKLDYYINEKKNAIAPKITDTGATTIQQEINDTFSAVASEAISELIQKAANNVSADLNSADAQLMTTIQNVRNNLADYQKTISSFKDTVAKSKPVLQNAIASLDDVDSAAKGASGAFSDTQKLFQQARDGLQNFSGSLTQGLSGSETSLTNFSVTAATRLGALETTGSQVSAALDDNIAAAEKLQQKNQNLLKSLAALEDSAGSDADLSQQIKDIKSQTQSYDTLLSSLKSSKKTVDGTTSSAKNARTDLRDLSAKSQKSLQTSKQDLLQDLIPKLYRILDDLANVNGSLSTALAGIEPLTEQGRTILQQLDAGLGTSVKQLEQTGQYLSRVDKNLEKIQTDLNALHSSETYQELLTLEGIDPDRVADFMASPVSLESKVVYNVENYGTGMTPFYTNLALWVGGLILVSILKQEVDPEGISRKRLDPTKAYFGRWLLFMAAGAIQGFIVCLGDLLLLGVQCAHPLLFVLEGIYCSLVYVNIIYALAITFKHIGKAVAVLLIILQIPGSSGTYPIEMMPTFFQKLYPLFPFSYGIDAMREAIAGFYGKLFVKDLLCLLVFVALAFFTGLVIRPLIMNLNHMFDRHLEKSELMLGEVPVSPEPNRKFYAVLKALLQHEESKVKLLEKSVQFEQHYPKLIRWGFLCMMVIPLLLLILMFSLESRLVFLILWIISLIAICSYLIIVEYIHDKMHRQLEINGMTVDDLTRSIKEEKEQ